MEAPVLKRMPNPSEGWTQCPTQTLPVPIINRLCTGDDRVVECYNNLDATLELNLDILDDYMSEAKEVHIGTTSGSTMDLHRIREHGGGNRRLLFDLLDECKLTKRELEEFAIALYGEDMMLAADGDSFPDPQSDWKHFCQTIDWFNSAKVRSWNPMTGRVGPWIDPIKH
jgi:hypothetical protein